MLRELEIKIEKIRNLIPYINQGGCGIFAHHLSEVLSKKYKLKHRIVYIDSEKKEKYNFKHILIEIDGYLLDSEGFYYRETSNKIKYLSKKKLKEYLSKKIWNKKFKDKELLIKLINNI
jgi:hypothetical protein